MTAKAPPRSVPLFDDYYMGLCYMIAARSKDPCNQQGAVIVDEDHRPLSWGYNGTLHRIKDTDVNWRRSEKDAFIVHAEENAIDNANGDKNSLKNSVLYVTGHPCLECFKRIVNKKIKRVVYGKQHSFVPKEDLELIKEICIKSYVVLDQHKGNVNWLREVLIHWQHQIPDLF